MNFTDLSALWGFVFHDYLHGGHSGFEVPS